MKSFNVTNVHFNSRDQTYGSCADYYLGRSNKAVLTIARTRGVVFLSLFLEGSTSAPDVNLSLARILSLFGDGQFLWLRDMTS